MFRLAAVAMVLVACGGGGSRTGAWPGEAGAGGAAGEGAGDSPGATGGERQGHPGGAAGESATGGQPGSTGGTTATGGAPATGGVLATGGASLATGGAGTGGCVARIPTDECTVQGVCHGGFADLGCGASVSCDVPCASGWCTAAGRCSTACADFGWECGTSYAGVGELCTGGGCPADQECGTWMVHRCSTCEPLSDTAYFCPDPAYPVLWGYCSSQHMPAACIPTTIVGDVPTRVCCALGSVAQG